MKKKTIFCYTHGILFAIGLVMGLIVLLAPRVLTLTTAVVIICLSLASGLLLPNPLSFWGLLGGIGMAFLPAKTVGLALMILGLLGMGGTWLLAARFRLFTVKEG